MWKLTEWVHRAGRGLILGAAVLVATDATAQSQDSTGTARQIAFSFDDAPRKDGPVFGGVTRTNVLIAALAEAQVEGAAFCVLTGNITKTPTGADRLRAYVEAGHVLANHSDSHPRLRETTPDAYLQDIDMAATRLEAFDGVLPLFRYPYLDEGDTPAKRRAVKDGLAARGLANGYVTIDTYDWYMQALLDEAIAAGHPVDFEALGTVYVEVMMEGIAFYDALASDTLGRAPRHVLLLHENDLAALYVDDLAVALRAEGWEIVPTQIAYADPIAQVVPETEFNGQGRVAAIAHARGTPPRDLVSRVEDVDYLRTLFEARGLLPSTKREDDP